MRISTPTAVVAFLVLFAFTLGTFIVVVSQENNENQCVGQQCAAASSVYCSNRARVSNAALRRVLADAANPSCCNMRNTSLENSEDLIYSPTYVALFTKTLAHSAVDGSLSVPTDYTNMRRGIVKNDQPLLASVPLASGPGNPKLVSPLSSWTQPLHTPPPCQIPLVPPPALASETAAAEMVEVYAMAVARDVAFVDYATDPQITQLLGATYVNSPAVLAGLLYRPPGAVFTAQTLFRGSAVGSSLGPYISQLLYFNVPEGGLVLSQRYRRLVARSAVSPPGSRVEWGVNKSETITMQNGIISAMPPLLPANVIPPGNLYIKDGRGLAEAVHADYPNQFVVQAALILDGLGVARNPGWAVYPNQAFFASPPGTAALVDVLGTLVNDALTHAWYWKWRIYRRLRPEAMGLLVQNVEDATVSNSAYGLSNTLLLNSVLGDVTALYGYYTLPQTFREGSPPHPSYPAGHGVIAGACVTAIKMFFNDQQLWLSAPGVTSGVLTPAGSPLSTMLEATSAGTTLGAYSGVDAAVITVGDELNKLASNVATGRNWAGIHYRSDGDAGMLLGEQIAIAYMRERLSTQAENNLNGTSQSITFTLFSGQRYTLRATVCS